MTATWGSARSALSKVLALREIILLNLLWGVLSHFLNCPLLFLDVDSRGWISMDMNESHSSPSSTMQFYRCEESDQDQSQSMQHWAEGT